MYLHQTVTDRYNFSCFADGSKINGQTGAALVAFTSYNREALCSFKWRLDDRNTVFQAEMMAINEACSLVITLLSSGSSIAIFNDSLSPVYALSATSSSSKLCIGARACLDNLATKSSSVTLLWIRGHTGVLGNDLADTAAKQGSSCDILKAVPLPPSLFLEVFCSLLDILPY